MEAASKSQVWIKVLRWLARVWSIPAIMFAGAHIISPDNGNGAQVNWYEWLAVGTMFLSVLALIVAWWKEKIGGWAAIILLVLSLIIYTIYAQEIFPWQGLLTLVIGVVVPAILFLVSARFDTPQQAI